MNPIDRFEEIETEIKNLIGRGRTANQLNSQDLDILAKLIGEQGRCFKLAVDKRYPRP